MSPALHGNERSWMIEVISELNTYLSGRDYAIKRVGGESTLYDNNRKHMFPDMILYGDSQRLSILQGWEAKMPDVPITDPDFIKDAHRKADALHLNSCMLWNFSYAQLHVKNGDNFTIQKTWDLSAYINNRHDVEIQQEKWKAELREIIDQLNVYFQNGIFSDTCFVDILTSETIPNLIESNKGKVANHIEYKANRDARLSAFLARWRNPVKAEGIISEDENIYIAYAKVILLNWINRILFASILKMRYIHVNSALSDITYSSRPQDLECTFSEITGRYDFLNIFKKLDYNELIPPTTWYELLEFLLMLKNTVNEEVPQCIIQNVMELTLDASKRELKGQYTTPAILAKILTDITIIQRDGIIYDCCCGTGTIPRAAIELKVANGLGIAHATESVWASDKYDYPLQIANISMARADAMHLPSRLFKQDIFTLTAGETINLVNPTTGRNEEYTIPHFDAIISNLPFVAAENARIQTPGISGKADLYVHIAIRLAALCKEGGRVGIITSNSWLASGFGEQFVARLQKDFVFRQVHICGKGRWFKNADVVTTILILERRATPTHSTPLFFKWKKSIEELQSDRESENRLIQSIQLETGDEDVVSMYSYSLDSFSQLKELGLSYNAFFHNVGWFEHLRPVLLPLHSIFNVFRGSRRGWDPLFFPKRGTHSIENEFLYPALYNAKNVHRYETNANAEAFCCSLSTEELERLNKSGALNWIKSFENLSNKKGKPLRSVLKTSSLEWYELQPAEVCEYFTMMNPNDRIFFSRFERPTFINQRLIGLTSKEGYTDSELNLALLNSVLTCFCIEARGFGRGLGVLDFSKNALESIWMLNPALLDTGARNRIVAAFNTLKARDIKPLMEELENSDRLHFEQTVFAAYGIEDYLQDTIASLKSMMKSRLSVRNS